MARVGLPLCSSRVGIDRLASKDTVRIDRGTRTRTDVRETPCGGVDVLGRAVVAVVAVLRRRMHAAMPSAQRLALQRATRRLRPFLAQG